jgi:hypothetical protein
MSDSRTGRAKPELRRLRWARDAAQPHPQLIISDEANDGSYLVVCLPFTAKQPSPPDAVGIIEIAHDLRVTAGYDDPGVLSTANMQRLTLSERTDRDDADDQPAH